MNFNYYSASELAVIETSIGCGFDLEMVAKSLNKRWHKNEEIRNANGLKKKVAKMNK